MRVFKRRISAFGKQALAGGIVAAALTAPLLAAQAAGYPERTITIVACFPAGGGTDVAMRMINTQLGEALGKAVVVENRAGAGGNIGIATVARAKSDGYTLLGCSSAFVVNPSLYAHVSYDAKKDFSTLMLIGSSPNSSLRILRYLLYCADVRWRTPIAVRDVLNSSATAEKVRRPPAGFA